MGDEDDTSTTYESLIIPEEIRTFMNQQGEINETYKEMFMESKQESEQQSGMLQRILAALDGNNNAGEDGPSKPKKRREDDTAQKENVPEQDNILEINVLEGDMIPDMHRDDEALAWDNRDGPTLEDGDEGGIGKGADGLEHTSGSIYQDLLDQSEEVLGDPIGEELATTIQKTWGKCILSTEKKNDLWKGIDIPSNCKVMKVKVPRLNEKIYIRLNENTWNKERAHQERQKGLSRAAIPLLYALGDVEKSQNITSNQYTLTRTEPKTLDDAKKQLAELKRQVVEGHNGLNGLRTNIQKSIRVLGYSFTQMIQSRKSDICQDLGRSFNVYTHDTKTGEDYIFDEDVMKTMKNELNAIKPKQKKGDAPGSFMPKNGNYPVKSQRGGYQQGYSTKPKQGSFSGNSNNNYSSNNNNYNNQNRNQRGFGKRGRR